MSSYEIRAYEGIDTFSDFINNFLSEKCKGYQETRIGEKSHIQFFKTYFKDIGVRTFIIENEYVDRDFLDDYAGYYVKCFKPYNRFCCRIHLFKSSFQKDTFENVLASSSNSNLEKQFQENYLGFLVIKPLPETIFGRTCISTYDDSTSRAFPIKRKYSANLFGLELSIHTLAFQEQDKVVAACATSALWSVFHGTGKLFQHQIPSPVQITKAAAKLPIRTTRMFPNRGLFLEEMAKAIETVGLEPQLEEAPSTFLLQTTSYAYLKGKIPLIIGLELVEKHIDKYSHYGYHAVALTGYNLGYAKPKSYGKYGFQLRATQIDKIYVHDDQIGPYSKMEFITNPEESKHVLLSTSWPNEQKKIGQIYVKNTCLLIPLYPKIRIPYDAIFGCIFSFDVFWNQVRNQTKFQKLEWDIYLTTANELKKELRNTNIVDMRTKKLDILQKGFPRFIWRASAFVESQIVFDFIFDATDIDQAKYLFTILEYDNTCSSFLRELSMDNEILDRMRHKHDVQRAVQILEWFQSSS